MVVDGRVATTGGFAGWVGRVCGSVGAGDGAGLGVVVPVVSVRAADGAVVLPPGAGAAGGVVDSAGDADGGSVGYSIGRGGVAGPRPRDGVAGAGAADARVGAVGSEGASRLMTSASPMKPTRTAPMPYSSSVLIEDPPRPCRRE